MGQIAVTDQTAALTVLYNIFHKDILVVSKVFPTDHGTVIGYRRVNCAEDRAYRGRCGKECVQTKCIT